ncbi:MFS general substrate transporter [Sistotremastrum niveocremeum HHB9708]|uniref:MFS general substrate transporter n=1 Tax=Sistotremastrum niveocremeum HHB9708 TaxID=1314777 RepID=A0A164M8T7_9AGAM|nr:MFS general substrate transporter [Sistotremastrum niveocremeum HHB9708]
MTTRTSITDTFPDSQTATFVEEEPTLTRTPSLTKKSSSPQPVISTLPKSSSPSTSPSLLEAEAEAKRPSSSLRILLLLFFCLAQFLDVFNVSALFPAVPTISEQLKMNASESVWIISAYPLTFASFLLLSGRLSDIYNPKYSFIAGCASLGLLSLGAGFTHTKIGLLVIRGISGVGGALTIPSALNLIVHLYPNEKEQALAISIFGASGAVGNVCGVIIGALLTQFAGWRWVFWLGTMIVLPIALLSIFLIPQRIGTPSGHQDTKPKGLDFVGVAIITAALILFIFGITSGSTISWGSAHVLAPIIISVFLGAAFFWYETTIPEDNACLPPSIWFYPNFAVLFGVALIPYAWWATTFLIWTEYFQEVYEWKPIIAAIHFLPIGIIAFPAFPLAMYLATRFGFRPVLLSAFALLIIATPLFTIGGSKNHYWSTLFPAFILGTLGASILYANTGIAMFQTTPSRLAGTVGAIFNSALQVEWWGGEGEL